MDLRTHDMGALPIYQAASKCRDILQQCAKEPMLMESAWAETQLAHFNLWTAGFGVFADRRAALIDQVLRERDNVYIVLNALALIQECTETCLEACAPEKKDTKRASTMLRPEVTTIGLLRPPDEKKDEKKSPTAIPHFPLPTQDQEQSDSEDLACAQEDVGHSIKQLVRLSEALRDTDLSTRYSEADKHFKATDHIELKTSSERFILAQHLDSKSSNLTPLQKRLVESNMRRRHWFLYSRRHPQRFDAGPTAESGIALTEVSEYSQNKTKAVIDHGEDWKSHDELNRVPTKPRRFRSKNYRNYWRVPSAHHGMARSRVPEAVPKYKYTRNITPASVDDYEKFEQTEDWENVLSESESEDNIDQSVQSGKTKTSSYWDESHQITGSTVECVYPQPPKVQAGAYNFKCPYCYLVLPLAYQEETLWREHLVDDIRPYTCIVDSCAHPEVLYTQRADWMQHIMQDHQNSWQCLLCSAPGITTTLYPTIEDFIQHTRGQHANAIPKDMLYSDSILFFATQHHVPFGISQCPLCDHTGAPDSEELLNHIAEHIHSFSLKSLPDPDSEHGIDDESPDYTLQIASRERHDFANRSLDSRDSDMTYELGLDITIFNEQRESNAQKCWPEDVTCQFVRNLEDPRPWLRKSTIRGLTKIYTRGASDIWTVPRLEALVRTFSQELAWMFEERIFDADPMILSRGPPLQALTALLWILLGGWVWAAKDSFRKRNPLILFRELPIAAFVALVWILYGDWLWMVKICITLENPFILFGTSPADETLLRTLIQESFWMVTDKLFGIDPVSIHDSRSETPLQFFVRMFNWQRQVKYYGLAHIIQVRDLDLSSLELPEVIIEALTRRLSDEDQSVRSAAIVAWGEIFANWRSGEGHKMPSSSFI